MQRIDNLATEAMLYGAKLPKAQNHDFPEKPNVGDIWFNNVDNKMYVYYEDFDSHAWIQVGGSAK